MLKRIVTLAGTGFIPGVLLLGPLMVTALAQETEVARDYQNRGVMEWGWLGLLGLAGLAGLKGRDQARGQARDEAAPHR